MKRNAKSAVQETVKKSSSNTAVEYVTVASFKEVIVKLIEIAGRERGNFVSEEFRKYLGCGTKKPTTTEQSDYKITTFVSSFKKTQ